MNLPHTSRSVNKVKNNSSSATRIAQYIFIHNVWTSSDIVNLIKTVMINCGTCINHGKYKYVLLFISSLHKFNITKYVF